VSRSLSIRGRFAALVAVYLIAALSLFMSAWMFLSWMAFDIPPRAMLKAASGTVDWMNGEQFHLAGVPQSLSYPRSGGAFGLVRSVLSSPAHPVISVLFDPYHHARPFGKDVAYHAVYELSVSGKVLRSYADVSEMRRRSEAFAPWLSAFLLLNGIFQLSVAARASMQPNYSLKRTAADGLR